MKFKRSTNQDKTSNKPPTGVINATDLKSNPDSELVDKPYMDPEKNNTPNPTKYNKTIFVL